MCLTVKLLELRGLNRGHFMPSINSVSLAYLDFTISTKYYFDEA